MVEDRLVRSLRDAGYMRLSAARMEPAEAVRAMIRSFDVSVDLASVSPAAFVSEVERFEVTVANPLISTPEKARAWDEIVRHASLLDPHEPGFARAGMALKEALCRWLDVRTARARH